MCSGKLRDLNFLVAIAVKEMSTILFSLFLNDLEQYLHDKNNANAIVIDANNNDSSVHLTLIFRLYADNTMILVETTISLQKGE